MSNFRDVVLSDLPFEWTVVQDSFGVGAPAMSDAVAISVRSDIDDFLARLMPAISADGVAIAFKYGDQFVCRASHGRAPRVGSVIEPGVGLCGMSIEQGRTVVEQEIEDEARSVVAAPIYLGTRLVGCIAAFAERKEAFGELDIETVTAVAGHLGEYELGPRTMERLEALQQSHGESEHVDNRDDYLGRLIEELYPTKTS